jgi:hypothetical protein
MMSAAPIDLPVNAPSDVQRRPDPVWVQGTEYLVPSFYDGRWHNAHFDAVVTVNGLPIERNGEVMTVGMVPPWRRYALDPGSAEALPQGDFERAKTNADQEYVLTKSGGKSNLAFPEKEPFPNVLEFLSWKRHPLEPEKLIPLGVSHERQQIRKGNHFYDPMQQKLVAWDSIPTDKQAKIVAALMDQGADVTPPAEEPAPLEPAKQAAVRRVLAAASAPCGREFKSLAGAKAHGRNCPDCQNVENPPEVSA